MRLDVFLTKKYNLAGDGRDFSRAQFQKIIAQSRVKINGEICKNSSREIREKDLVEVNFPENKNFAKEIADFQKNNVIYEDQNVVVVNKPAGILTHAKGAFCDEFTVADFILSRISAPEKFANKNRPGIVHRLDRGTSGVLIAAKNFSTMKFLMKQFQDRKVKKKYLALVKPAPKNFTATIDLPIARNPKSPSTFRVDPGGKNALTFYEILQIFSDNSALVSLSPRTGRTHQLRVHLNYIGSPIIGDLIYSIQKNQKKNSTLKGESRMFLHAKQLEITIPNPRGNDNLRKIFTAELPDDFQKEIACREELEKNLSLHSETNSRKVSVLKTPKNLEKKI